MPLPTSGRGGTHAWAPASAPYLPPAPTTTTVPGRVHPPLPATSAPPPTAPPVTPPPLPVDLAQMFEAPIGLDTVPATLPAPAAMAPTASSSSWPERLNSSPPRSSKTAVAVPVAKPAGSRWGAALADRRGGQPQTKKASFSSSIDSTTSCPSSCSSDDSGQEPGNTATPPAAPPPPADLAQVSEESVGLSAASTAPPAASSSSWLEQLAARPYLRTVSLTSIPASWLEQLAQELEDRLTGMQVSETVLIGIGYHMPQCRTPSMLLNLPTNVRTALLTVSPS